MELIEGLKVIKEYSEKVDNCEQCLINGSLCDNGRACPVFWDFRKIKPAVKKITTPEA